MSGKSVLDIVWSSPGLGEGWVEHAMYDRMLKRLN